MATACGTTSTWTASTTPTSRASPGCPWSSGAIPDGDGTPDWEGFGGVEVTDEDGYYRFDGLAPGNYVVFVWQVDNWGDGEPLNGFQSTGYFVADANNDIDLDNNGSGPAFSDIMSGIVTLTLDGNRSMMGTPKTASSTTIRAATTPSILASTTQTRLQLASMMARSIGLPSSRILPRISSPSNRAVFWIISTYSMHTAASSRHSAPTEAPSLWTCLD